MKPNMNLLQLQRSRLVVSLTRPTCNAVVASLFALVPAVLGCGGGAPAGPQSKVHGKVTYQGKPITTGSVVSFMPENGPGAASGTVAADGSYELQSIDDNQIPTGKYKVLINPPPTPPMSAEEAMKASMAKDKPKGPVEDPTIPKKYRNIVLTPEKYDLKEGDNEINIELKDK